MIWRAILGLLLFAWLGAPSQPTSGNQANQPIYVTNTNALNQFATLTVPNSLVCRLGKATPGDSAYACFKPAAPPGPCSLNNGAGDGATQIPSGDRSCWLIAPNPIGILGASSVAPPIANTQAQIDALIEQVANPAWNFETIMAQQNTGVPAYAYAVFSKQFDPGTPVANLGEGEVLTAYGVANFGCVACGTGGGPFDVVPIDAQLLMTANDSGGVLINAVAQGLSTALATHVNLFEGDMVQQAGIGLSPGNNQGLVLVAGNNPYDCAVCVGSFTAAGLPTGTWAEGLKISYLASNGYGIKFDNTLTTNYGVYSGTGTFNGSFILADTNQTIAFGPAFGNDALLFYDGSNFNIQQAAGGGAPLRVRNSGGTSLLVVQSGGSVIVGTADLQIANGFLQLTTQNTPADTTACTKGEIVADSNFIYYCAAAGGAGNWKRATLAAY